MGGIADPMWNVGITQIRALDHSGNDYVSL